MILYPTSNRFHGNASINKPVLLIEQTAVKQWRDTLYYYKLKLRTCRYATIPVILGNNTSDTLKYVNMSCSTLDIFTTSTNDARIFEENRNCFKNGPAEFKIPPYGSVKFDVPVYFFAAESNSIKVPVSKDFRIGMGFFKYTGKKSLLDYIVKGMSL